MGRKRKRGARKPASSTHALPIVERMAESSDGEWKQVIKDEPKEPTSDVEELNVIQDGEVTSESGYHLSNSELDRRYDREVNQLGKPATSAHLERDHNENSGGMSQCSICGRPISEKYLPFHLRTHLNFQEQKQYLLQRKEKDKRKSQNESAPKICRLEQLQRMLDAREKALVDKRNMDQSGKNSEEVEVLKGTNIKRGGNYGPVQCSQCGKIFTTVYRLIPHEQIVHGLGSDKLVKCSICARPFGQKPKLKLHITTHLNLEERAQFIKWPGEIEEFVERLNTGEDLTKPPVQVQISRRRGRKRKDGADTPVRKILNKIGRPRKHHHLYDKKGDTVDVGVETAKGNSKNEPVSNYLNSIHGGADQLAFSHQLPSGWTGWM